MKNASSYMPEIELTLNAVKCPLCDFNHNFKVKIEYMEKSVNSQNQEKKYYNFFIAEEKVGENTVKVPIYEIDGYCPKKNSPFRILVNPRIPVDSIPTNFIVTVLS